MIYYLNFVSTLLTDSLRSREKTYFCAGILVPSSFRNRNIVLWKPSGSTGKSLRGCISPRSACGSCKQNLSGR